MCLARGPRNPKPANAPADAVYAQVGAGPVKEKDKTRKAVRETWTSLRVKRRLSVSLSLDLDLEHL